MASTLNCQEIFTCTCASRPPVPRRPPLRAAPRGAAQPDPGLAARESARRSDGYETGSLRPFRRHRLPLFAGPSHAAAAATTNGSAGLWTACPPLATSGAASQSRPPDSPPGTWGARPTPGSAHRMEPEGSPGPLTAAEQTANLLKND